MKRAALVLCLFASCHLFSPCLNGEDNAPTLDHILARMDQTGPGLRSASADLKMVSHTAVIDDDTAEAGTMKMQKLSERNVRAIIEFTGQKDPRTIAFLDKQVKIFYPKLKLVQVYDLGRDTSLLNQFLLLGFGATGNELRSAYDITLTGTEHIGGHPASVLTLVPKSKAALERLSKAQIWYSLETNSPVQQKFLEPSGNYRLITYSNYKANADFGRGALEMKVPSGTKEEKPR